MRKLLFWIVMLTWGLPMTLIGLVFFLGNALFNNIESLKFPYGRIEVNLRVMSGGVSLGGFYFVNAYHAPFIRRHERGHSRQVMIWGWLFLFVIGIPSIVRAAFWSKIKAKHPEKSYYDIWFEDQATRWGDLYYQ